MTYDDGYDDYDEQPVEPQMGDAEAFMRRALDIIASAPNMPLSSTPRIDRDEIIEIIGEAWRVCPRNCAKRVGCCVRSRNS